MDSAVALELEEENLQLQLDTLAAQELFWNLNDQIAPSKEEQQQRHLLGDSLMVVHQEIAKLKQMQADRCMAVYVDNRDSKKARAVSTALFNNEFDYGSTLVGSGCLTRENRKCPFCFDEFEDCGPQVECATPVVAQVDRKPAAIPTMPLDSCPKMVASGPNSMPTLAVFVCGHRCCVECINAWVRFVTNNGQFPLTCPVQDCAQVIKPKDLENVISDVDLFGRFCARFFEYEHASKGMYCPNKQCSAFIFQLPSRLHHAAECSKCKRSVCLKCRVPWHVGYTCTQYQALPRQERLPEDLQLLDLAKNNKWKRCPSCRFVVERRMGCYHMRCRCKAEFCYICGRSYVRKVSTAAGLEIRLLQSIR